MATVAHPLPTMQASDEQTAQMAWQRACALAADRLSATAEPGRLAKGLVLAQTHKVTMSLTDEHDDYAQVKSGKVIYTITHEGVCPCEDFQKRQTSCKHLLALLIHQSAPTFYEHEHEQGHAEAAPEAFARVMPPPEPAPVPHTVNIDNPAGFNWKARVGSTELWYTFHAESDLVLLARLQETLPQLQQMVLAYEEQAKTLEAQRKAAQTPAAPLTVDEHLASLVAEAVQKALKGTGFPASAKNGTKPTAPVDGNDTDASWCPHHSVPMDYHPANDRGPAWYSHRLGSGGYCRGGN